MREALDLIDSVGRGEGMQNGIAVSDATARTWTSAAEVGLKQEGQGRVTDHRINLTLYNLAKVMEGENLDDVINPLIAEDQAARLSALEDEFG